MLLDFTNFLYALSYALDAVEAEVTGASVEHGKRVALISYWCSRSLNLNQDQMISFMACLDIYQVLTEKRPYKDGMNHKQDMKIMYSMVADGKIDSDITKDIDICFGTDVSVEGNDLEDDIEDAIIDQIKLTNKRWKYDQCGYIYEGDTPPLFCPLCDSDIDSFKLI